MARLKELSYVADSTRWFDRVAAMDFSIFLDSGRIAATTPATTPIAAGRYDIILANPVKTIQADVGTVRSPASVVINNSEQLLSMLRQVMTRSRPGEDNIVFSGGVAGFMSYDLGMLLQQLPTTTAPTLAIPDLAVGVYDVALLVDHEQRRCFLVADDSISEQRWQWFSDIFSPGPTKLPPPLAPAVPGPLGTTMSQQQYAKAFSRIQQHILRGDCYQVNLTQRFTLEYDGDSWELYRYLRTVNPAPMATFMRLPQQAILSCSPERFISCSNGRVESRPIKGTRPRADPGYEDMAQAEALLASDKDRAENLMIVDLIRNDLARSCIPGSISVPGLFHLESYATVHHIVSSVVGRLRPDKDCFDLLLSCFPGGSITGAPKHRAMQIIEKLENSRRHLYCGSIFYISNNGNMDSNIAIRTTVHEAGRLHYWAGGGIVHDSVMAAEYEEMYNKAAAFTRLQNS